MRLSSSSSDTERSAALWPGAGILARRPRSYRSPPRVLTIKDRLISRLLHRKSNRPAPRSFSPPENHNMHILSNKSASRARFWGVAGFPRSRGAGQDARRLDRGGRPLPLLIGEATEPANRHQLSQQVEPFGGKAFGWDF